MSCLYFKWKDMCTYGPRGPFEVHFVTRITEASKCKSGLCLLQGGASQIAFFMFPATLLSHLALILADVARPTCTHSLHICLSVSLLVP